MATQRRMSVNDKALHIGLKEKSFGIKDIRRFDENNVRQLRYWISLGMVGGSEQGPSTDSAETGGWDKFNFYEFIWIFIVRELKELNFDNQIIKRCAEEIFSRWDKNHEMLEFEKAILYTLRNRKDVFFIINKDGEFNVYRPEDLTKIAEKKELKTCIVMNLVPLLKDFLSTEDFLNYIAEWGLLKENEVKALRLLHDSKTASVRIGLSNRNIIIKQGEKAVIEFIENIFIHDYRTISIQL